MSACTTPMLKQSSRRSSVFRKLIQDAKGAFDKAPMSDVKKQHISDWVSSRAREGGLKADYSKWLAPLSNPSDAVSRINNFRSPFNKNINTDYFRSLRKHNPGVLDKHIPYTFNAGDFTNPIVSIPAGELGKLWRSIGESPSKVKKHFRDWNTRVSLQQAGAKDHRPFWQGFKEDLTGVGPNTPTKWWNLPRANSYYGLSSKNRNTFHELLRKHTPTLRLGDVYKPYRQFINKHIPNRNLLSVGGSLSLAGGAGGMTAFELNQNINSLYNQLEQYYPKDYVDLIKETTSIPGLIKGEIGNIPPEEQKELVAWLYQNNPEIFERLIEKGVDGASKPRSLPGLGGAAGALTDLFNQPQPWDDAVENAMFTKKYLLPVINPKSAVLNHALLSPAMGKLQNSVKGYEQKAAHKAIAQLQQYAKDYAKEQLDSQFKDMTPRHPKEVGTDIAKRRLEKEIPKTPGEAWDKIKKIYGWFDTADMVAEESLNTSDTNLGKPSTRNY